MLLIISEHALQVLRFLLVLANLTGVLELLKLLTSHFLMVHISDNDCSKRPRRAC